MGISQSLHFKILLFVFAALAVSACSDGDDAEANDEAATENGAESTTTTTEPATTTTEAADLPTLTGFCAEVPLTEIVALFEEATFEETVANADTETCGVELISDSGATVAAFSLGVINDVGPGDFEETQEELFAANREVEEETDSVSRPFREAFLLGDQAEIITGAVSQLSILDGERIWYVQQGEDDERLDVERLVEVGQLVLDNAPTS